MVAIFAEKHHIFDMNGQPIELSFKDPDIRGLTQFKRFKELEEKMSQ